MVVPTSAQIRAQVSAVLGKMPDARVIGIKSPLTVELGDTLRVGDMELAVARSDSVLEIRERLEDLAEGSAPVVLLTPVEETELGADVIGRLARRQLFTIDPWQLVKDRFRARFVDPRLVQQHPWVARVLLEAEPDGGYPPAPSGFIQADLVWEVLFKALLGLPNSDRDAEAWIEWSLDPDKRLLASKLSPETRSSLSDAVQRMAGAAARTVFDCATGEHGDRTLALGLVARVLFADESRGDVVATKATGKLEALVDAEELATRAALAWADAAESLIARLLARRPMKQVRPLLKEADELLASLGASELARSSRFLLTGFNQRLEGFGKALAAALKGRKREALKRLETALDLVVDHALAAHEAARVEGVEMGARLARWLARETEHQSTPASSLADAAAAYRRESGYVDWARARIWEGDTNAALGKAYSTVWQVVTSAREEENRRFGALLANWTKTGSHDQSVIRVEHLVERVIAPLAKRHPVLLVVIDGMGMAVFRELQTDLIGRGWVEIDSADDSQRLPVIAALPTVTEVSRTSLLCGALATGNFGDEKTGFSKHPSLVAAGSRSKPPILFHKADLAGDGTAGVASSVVGAITDDKQRVVGVVINAVDDHLAKGDQIRVDWTVHRIKPLDELLAAASDAGRAVVVVSDHGHIPEHKTTGRFDASAERWREAVGSPKDDEVLLSGPRVVVGNGQRIIAPWSESVRYSAKKNGYHGGAAPQEVVIPLGIFAPAGMAIEGWVEATSETPGWWEPEIEETVPTVKPAKVAKPKPPLRPGEQGRLFPDEEEIAAAEEAIEPEWIDRLLASELMAAQRQLASRVALPEERIRVILSALDEWGGKLTRPALAKRIGVPPMRLGGIISALRRLLNVEGYPVLSVDEQSDTVSLNRRQLFTQFGL
jgi:hypothetical protein